MDLGIQQFLGHEFIGHDLLCRDAEAAIIGLEHHAIYFRQVINQIGS
jgi:hypothetical protein